ncbi:methylated-DNA--[protein]-cysteine S-methyltransferase [Fulvivirga lutea]|uniref:Methylated-DNA--protein-cysteine methyltransferase n=1 Tax=Fulvivirga lutea TaxID=2810512 RepID=A0A974WJY8_9BACT|nr:methylated-DNA--[protein]-cysteine S-methyltransferase [Fulvivirga lutea]QSE97535.1 methylated-DNA--[protein]-cysteine S-methyltransferase [Fulvivirga lutea]
MYQEVYKSPIGDLLISSDADSIISIEFDGSIDSHNPSALTSECISQLKEYFSDERNSFDLPLNPEGTEFQKSVWNQLLEIPFGKSISYSKLAVSLGDIKTIRAAGTANGKNKIPIIIPCHRVIGKDGSMVGFSGGVWRKEWLLKHEGILQGEQMKIFG